jgi:hypothetical protein
LREGRPLKFEDMRRCDKPRCEGLAVRIRLSDPRHSRDAKLLKQITALMKESIFLGTLAAVAGSIVVADEHNQVAFYRCRKCHHFFYAVI